jgi:hypothetical protein
MARYSFAPRHPYHPSTFHPPAAHGPAKGVPAPTRPGNSLTGPGVQAAPPDVGGRPLDPAEIAAGVSANRNLALGQAGATYQLGQLQQEYGYGETGAANPYSRAALLQESFQRSKLGTTNNYAAGGQLYSGAYGRAQGENQRQYSIGENANRRAYDQAVYGVNYGQAQNAATYGTDMDQTSYEALLRALGIQ